MIEKVLSWCGKHGYESHLIGKNPKTVLIGELHRNRTHRTAQEELIQLLAPEFLIHEHAGPLIYDPRTREWTIQQGVKMNHSDRNNLDLYKERFLEEWARRYSCIIVGNDHSQTETELFISGKKGWEEAENSASELRMGSRIAEYAKKTTRPLIAINGCAHVREDAVTHQALKRAGLSYIVVDQTDED